MIINQLITDFTTHYGAWCKRTDLISFLGGSPSSALYGMNYYLDTPQLISSPPKSHPQLLYEVELDSQGLACEMKNGLCRTCYITTVKCASASITTVRILVPVFITGFSWCIQVFNRPGTLYWTCPLPSSIRILLIKWPISRNQNRPISPEHLTSAG